MGSCASKNEPLDQTKKPNSTVETKTFQTASSTPPVDSTAEKVPTVFENYDVGEEIGRGAFSVVKRAVQRKTKEECAIKFIEKKFVDKQDLVLLAREIDIMKKVSHPNVLKLREVYETEETIALVMELVTGGELFYKIVEKGNYSSRDAANIVRQIVEGVAYLHSEGICHRDLKPENLLCANEKELKYKPFRVVIADFGLSKLFNNGEELATSCGTPDYVAPEVITAEGSYDNSVDMWSVGVITYVLLCGFSPFLSSTQTGLFEKIIKAEYDFPEPEWSNVSEKAKDFIRHLLRKDPTERYTAVECLKHVWLSEEENEEALANGNISDKMKTYNEKRRQSFKQ